jgi:hypothetical protein
MLLFYQKACELSYADASEAQIPINQIKALIIADKKFKIHQGVPHFGFPSFFGWASILSPHSGWTINNGKDEKTKKK